MADVQTNLLSYILTKLHSDVARIESLIHQVHTDVDYLLQARQISNEDAQLILSKVPQPIHVDAAPAPSTALVQAGSSLQLTTLPTPILNSTIQPVASPAAQSPLLSQAQSSAAAAAKRAVPPPPKKVQARALWDYNTDGDEPKDLTFYKDDIIEIISEANADWWTGKANGRTGLFPSNYVEKLVHPVPPALANLRPSSPANPQPIVVHLHPSQPQPEAAQQQQPQQPYVPYRNTHAPTPPAHHEGEKREGKYTQLKSTMAHSAAGGLGFGAGAAIGGGLVRAIF